MTVSGHGATEGLILAPADRSLLTCALLAARSTAQARCVVLSLNHRAKRLQRVRVRMNSAGGGGGAERS